MDHRKIANWYLSQLEKAEMDYNELHNELDRMIKEHARKEARGKHVSYYHEKAIIEGIAYKDLLWKSHHMDYIKKQNVWSL
jgi:regulator of sirC expression with transglutaminase-like and TPR domain